LSYRSHENSNLTPSPPDSHKCAVANNAGPDKGPPLKAMSNQGLPFFAKNDVTE